MMPERRPGSQESRRSAGPLRIAAYAQLAWMLVGGLNRCCRFNYLQEPYSVRRQKGESVRCLYAIWHESLWHIAYAFRGQGLHALVSQHSDGEIIARTLQRFGFNLVRGSSTRGGARALLELARVASQTSDDIIVTVDGPKGPAREVKEGLLFVASRSGLPIVPVAVVAARAWRARSWDRLVIGKPLSRVVISQGDEIRVPPTADRESLQAEHSGRLKAGLLHAEQLALAQLRA
ncbi:MAG: lysophospholipid acyltransferase family protein [Planctomycetota bacterium]